MRPAIPSVRTARKLIRMGTTVGLPTTRTISSRELPGAVGTDGRVETEKEGMAVSVWVPTAAREATGVAPETAVMVVML
jgi:hypothetical protein